MPPKSGSKAYLPCNSTNAAAAHANTGHLAFNMDPGETTGIAITRESPDSQHRTIVGTYEHQHRNLDIHRNRRSRLRCRPARFSNRANARTEGRLSPSIQRPSR